MTSDIIFRSVVIFELPSFDQGDLFVCWTYVEDASFARSFTHTINIYDVSY